MKIEDFTLHLGDDEIPWRLFAPEHGTKEYCVLWLQGWSSSMDSHRPGVERMVQQSSLAFATMDYAGHGLHKLPLEESTQKQQHEETVAVFDQLKERGYKNIIVIGGSFGGYLAALLTGARPVHTAILRAPANYSDEEFELPEKETLRNQDYVAYVHRKTDEGMLKRSLATKAIAEFEGFTYVLEHELDDDVPAKVPKLYFEVAKNGNYIIIPKTKHSPKLMKHPQPHYNYIEHIVCAILKAAQLQDGLDDA